MAIKKLSMTGAVDPGSDPKLGVDTLRTKILMLKAEIRTIETVPQTPREALLAARAWVERKAAEWQPYTGWFTRPDGTGEGFHLLRPGPDLRDDLERMTCVLHANAIITALESRIVREIEDAGGGLTAEERADKLKRLRAELLAVELDEERLIQQSERNGAPIARRGDADVEVVLGLADQPERRAA